MQNSTSTHIIDTLPALEALFGSVSEAAIRKEVPFLHPVYQAFIKASPFVILASSGPRGLDVSPRGDPPGFVVVQDEHTLLLPERRGNNRIDTLRNLLVNPQVALLFLIPGIGEGLRVNGRVRITTAPELMQKLAMKDALPQCVLEITVETALFQCARAIARSQLWQGVSEEVRLSVPSAGTMLTALSLGSVDGEKYDRELPERLRTTLY